MLLVNNIALNEATPIQLQHAHWNKGIHIADLVFPWFLFCMGLAIPFSSQSMITRGMPLWARVGRVLLRTATLFLLGCLLVSAANWRPTFSLDVLQLIALAYFFGWLLYPLRWPWRLALASLLLVGYGMALLMVPLPPDNRPAFEETHNLVKHVNEQFLSQFSLAGLLSVIPTTALVLIAATVTDAVRSEVLRNRQKLALLAGSGLLMTALGSFVNQILPYNKAVWTPSYILFSAGLGTLALAPLYAVLDVKRWSGWAKPLLIFGSNALVAYVFPVLAKLVILNRVKIPAEGRPQILRQAMEHAFMDPLGRYWGGWAYTLTYMLAVWLVLWVLYWRRWFVRI